MLTIELLACIKIITENGANSMTRKSTPKYHVIHASSDVKVIENVSKTEAIKFAREMSGEKKNSFIVKAAIDCKD